MRNDAFIDFIYFEVDLKQTAFVFENRFLLGRVVHLVSVGLVDNIESKVCDIVVILRVSFIPTKKRKIVTFTGSFVERDVQEHGYFWSRILFWIDKWIAYSVFENGNCYSVIVLKTKHLRDILHFRS